MRARKPLFDDYYAELFPGRWPALREALSRPTEARPFEEGLVKPYYLDTASVIAARALGPTGNARVLDLCAAPGGKTLVLASSLGPEGRIVANERSADRRGRLRRVLDAHLPPEVRERITVTGHDAARWGLYEQDLYDLVLLDAPCSSERHVIESPKHLASWSPSRSVRLARQAYAMLLSAMAAAKPGGRILYSTCALSPAENDDVVEKAMKRRPGVITPLPTDGSVGERSRFGTMIWPDTSEGLGPMYFALLAKNEAGPVE